MLDIKNLSFSYSRKQSLLRDFSMQLESGTVTGLLGRNGAGKSTLIYLICGLLRPQSGTIRFDNINTAERTPALLSDIFLVPEEFKLPSVTLEKYVEANAQFYPRFDRALLEKLLDIFELNSSIHLAKLSMGQKKKAFIAFALACRTSLLILDEPTNGLDISGKRAFRRVVSESMTDETTIIISTHQVYDIDKILDHVVIMDRSGVLLDESIAEIQSRLSFNFTTDRQRAEKALIALDVPGGYNIAETLTDDNDETEVNLETLFELITSTHSKTLKL
ncbi:MAG: ABC transporter ATP-binding protein [Muribaculaceae bacterium]|nr:ABC transporter ATP-binding protein [Muribaculaceae bacterium]